jgi:hypothetical protein
MMGLDERVAYWLLGVLVGFILGRLTKTLRTIDQKVDEVIELEKHDEKGSMRLPKWVEIKALIARINTRALALLLVVVLTAYASIQSQMTSNDVRAGVEQDRKTQERISRITTCNSQFLGRTILALNERTQFSTDQAKANIALQQEQLRFLTLALTVPPPDPDDGRRAVDQYLDKLNRYVELASKTAGKQALNEYPTLDDFTNCVEKDKELMIS